MISKRIEERMKSGSLIRKMFEEGKQLKARYGEDNVFDFSLGNPDVPPPAAVEAAILSVAKLQVASKHGYMSNNGYEESRRAVAFGLSHASGINMSPQHICMTVGAAGAMNAALRAILDPGDEVMLLSPFFMEYTAYIDNHFGVPVIVPTDPDTFDLNLAAIKKAITDKTKAIIINSPNNPSGRIYPQDQLLALNDLLISQKNCIHVISDEPYRELVFDGHTTPATLACFKNLIICYSWSKSLSLAGERIGYCAVSPLHQDIEPLMSAIVLCNRILGSVNAPAFFQRVIAQAIHAKVDITSYEKRRDMLYDIITKAGFLCNKPDGAMYLFPKSPTDDASIVAALAKENILAVPGSAFACPGYFRLAFCVAEKTILGSEEGFMKIGQSL